MLALKHEEGAEGGMPLFPHHLMLKENENIFLSRVEIATAQLRRKHGPQSGNQMGEGPKRDRR
jgi:hypothetical protein